MSSADSLTQSFSPEADQRLHDRHPARRSPRLSSSMSSCLHWLQRFMWAYCTARGGNFSTSQRQCFSTSWRIGDHVDVRFFDEAPNSQAPRLTACRAALAQHMSRSWSDDVTFSLHACPVTRRICAGSQAGHDSENGALGLLTSQVVACFHCGLVFLSRTKRLLFFCRLAVSARSNISLGVHAGHLWRVLA